MYIGVYAKKDEGTFYANDNFRLFFPALWVEHYGDEQVFPHFLELGVYLLSLLILHRTGLYPILHDSFGLLNGNAMLDFVRNARTLLTFSNLPWNRAYCSQKTGSMMTS